MISIEHIAIGRPTQFRQTKLETVTVHPVISEFFKRMRENYVTPMQLQRISGRSSIVLTRMRHGFTPNFAAVADILEAVGFDLKVVERPIPFIRHRK
jgi:hypothetical protein